MTRTFEEIQDRNEAALAPMLTEVFLATLVSAAKTCGHAVDYPELCEFVNWCHDLAGKPDPELEPYNQN